MTPFLFLIGPILNETVGYCSQKCLMLVFGSNMLLDPFVVLIVYWSNDLSERFSIPNNNQTKEDTLF